MPTGMGRRDWGHLYNVRARYTRLGRPEAQTITVRARSGAEAESMVRRHLSHIASATASVHTRAVRDDMDRPRCPQYALA